MIQNIYRILSSEFSVLLVLPLWYSNITRTVHTNNSNRNQNRNLNMSHSHFLVFDELCPFIAVLKIERR